MPRLPLLEHNSFEFPEVFGFHKALNHLRILEVGGRALRLWPPSSIDILCFLAHMSFPLYSPAAPFVRCPGLKAGGHRKGVETP